LKDDVIKKNFAEMMLFFLRKYKTSLLAKD